MITEWQPIMPEDKIKFKSRTIYELLHSDKTTKLIVGPGVDVVLSDSQLFEQAKSFTPGADIR